MGMNFSALVALVVRRENECGKKFDNDLNREGRLLDSKYAEELAAGNFCAAIAVFAVDAANRGGETLRIYAAGSAGRNAEPL